MRIILLLFYLAVAPDLFASDCGTVISSSPTTNQPQFHWLERIPIDAGSPAALHPEIYAKLKEMLKVVLELPMLTHEIRSKVEFFEIYNEHRRILHHIVLQLSNVIAAQEQRIAASQQVATIEQTLYLDALIRLKLNLAPDRDPFSLRQARGRDAISSMHADQSDKLQDPRSLRAMLRIPAHLFASVLVGFRYADFFTFSIPADHLVHDLRETLQVEQWRIHQSHLAHQRIDVVIVDRDTNKLAGIIVDVSLLWDKLPRKVIVGEGKIRNLARLSKFIRQNFQVISPHYVINYLATATLSQASSSALSTAEIGTL